jgi:sugar lactone lactonase YvrE
MMRFDYDGSVLRMAPQKFLMDFGWTNCLARGDTPIGKVLIPEMVGNLCFGGPKLNRLFICGTSALYSVCLNVNGVSPITDC